MKKEKPLDWATVFCSILDAAKKWVSYSVAGSETLRSTSNTLTVNMCVVAQQISVSILRGICIFGLTSLSLAPQHPHFYLYVKVVCSASLYRVSSQSRFLQSFHTKPPDTSITPCFCAIRSFGAAVSLIFATWMTFVTPSLMFYYNFPCGIFWTPIKILAVHRLLINPCSTKCTGVFLGGMYLFVLY